MINGKCEFKVAVCLIYKITKNTGKDSQTKIKEDEFNEN